MKRQKIAKHSIGLTLIAVLVSGCGGGGGASAPTPPPPPTNAPPTVDAGRDQTADETTTVQLDGTASDPEGTAVTFAWSQVSGPNVVIADATSATTSVALPEVPIGNTDPVVLSLQATDADGARSTDEMMIFVESVDALAYADANGLFSFDPDTEVRTLVTPVFNNIRFSEDRRWFAFTADTNTTDQQELFVVPASGGPIVQISAPMQADGDVLEIAWSPDGTQIAYTADAEQDDVFEVYLVDRDGSNHRKINGAVGNPASVDLVNIRWSPDGRYLAQNVRRLSDNVVFGINTYDQQNPGSVRITSALSAGQRINSQGVGIQWSPDSQRVAYLMNDPGFGQRLFTARPDGSDNPEIASDFTVGQFTWAPDASRIAYLAYNARRELLSTAAPDGTDIQSLSTDSQARQGGLRLVFRWSPDSSLLAFMAERNGGNFQLYVIRPDGTGELRVSTAGNVGDARFPQWSPDSSWLLYMADQDTVDVVEAYVVRPDGTENLRVSGNMPTDGDVLSPFWSPDGSYILYVAEQDDPTITELYRVAPDASENIKLNAPLAPRHEVSFVGFSLDDSRIRYQTNDSSQETFVFVISPDGQNLQQVVDGSGGASRGSSWTR